MHTKIIIDISEYYYLPQFEPIILELQKRGLEVICVSPERNRPLLEVYLKNKTIEFVYLNDPDTIDTVITATKPAWVFFGNGKKRLETTPEQTKFALVLHGVGPKSCYYEVSEGDFDIRFVEGQQRLNKLQSMFPHKKFLDTGFAKLDPIINQTITLPDHHSLGLDPDKKTICYAPSFFPSSIGCFPANFPEYFSGYNLIIKPHYFTLARKKFSRQKKLVTHWASYANVHLVPITEVNILPYYAISDLLVSEASSTLFEFCALDKPIIWFDQYKLSLFYRGPFNYRLKKRMDPAMDSYRGIGAHAGNLEALQKQVALELASPDRYSPDRLKMIDALVGKVDGKVSERIVKYLLETV